MDVVAALQVIPGDPRKPEGARGGTHRNMLDPDAPQHLVFHLDQVVGIEEEIRFVCTGMKQCIDNALRAWIQHAGCP